MKKIKILFILPKTTQGGAETQLLYLLSNINRSRFVVYLGLLYDDEKLKTEFFSLNKLEIIHFKKKGKFDISVFFKIAKFVKQNKIDIIHSFMGNHHSYLPFLLCRKILPIGCIMGARKTELSFLDKLFAKYTKYLLTSVSVAGKEIYVSNGFPNEKICLVNTAINYKYFSSGKAKLIIDEFNLNNHFIIGIIGRLIPTKNHLILIQIFKELYEANNRLVLMIVGDGPLRDVLEKLAIRSNLKKNVIFTGNRRDIPDILASMDLFVFPSISEGLPNVILEAMAAGLPVVSYDAGDIKYIIRNDYNGILVDNNAVEFKDEIDALIKNETKMKKISINARKTIKDKFSVLRMVRSYEKVYINNLKNQNENPPN